MNISPTFWKKAKLKQKLLTLSSSIFLLYCSGVSSVVMADDKAESDVIGTVLEEIEVLGIAPLSSASSSDKSSHAIQIFNAQDIAKTVGYSIAQLLEQQAGSITSNGAQNNPLQPDIRLRGFTASPLLGVSQGVVVYQNGVRINETFGDTVNWDLLPISTFESVGVVAGSNPVLGLNALGGAIALNTKDGFSTPQRTMTLEYGSFETHALNITSGGNNDSLGYFITIDGMEEEGWRDFSDSQALNAYAAFSWRDKRSELDVYLNRGDTTLRGNGSVPEVLLNSVRHEVFTHPDITKNNMSMATLSFKHWFMIDTQLSMNLFYRDNVSDSFNGDASEFDQCHSPFELFLCSDEGSPIKDDRGNLVADNFNAINNRSKRAQKTWGSTIQLYTNQELLGVAHHIIIGTDFLIGQTRFKSSVEFAELTESRSTTTSDFFDADGFTDLRTENQLGGLYFTDTIKLMPSLSVTFSTRYNSAQIQTNDQSGNRPELDGSHRYSRLNSGLGMTYQLNGATSLYAGVYQASRAPTPVELACAHADAPCNLPNTFLADPPLDDVVSLSYEIGLRGETEHVDQWHIGAFHTANQDDILFQTTGGVLSNQGFFTNAADTQRVGLEINLKGTADDWAWFTNYSYLNATFEDIFISSSPNHPSAINGVLEVNPGAHIPGIPEHNLKLGISYYLSERLTSRVDMLVNSGQYLRGDEANLDAKIASYFLLNTSLEYQFSDQFNFTINISNLLNKDYESFGLYGEASEVLEEVGTEKSRFLSPGMPRKFSMNLKLWW